MRKAIFLTAALLTVPVAGMAQVAAGPGPTQSRDGLPTASQGKGATNNSMPAGSINATTGPQSRPAYPSGSSTPNPGAAFVRSGSPTPATGPARRPTGVLSTKSVTSAGSTSQPQSAGVGQAATPPK